MGHRRTDRQTGRSRCTHRQQNKYPHVSVCLRFVEPMLSMYAFCLGPINGPSPLPILSPPSQSTHSPSTHFHCQFTIPTPWESPMHLQANSAEGWHKKKQLYTTPIFNKLPYSLRSQGDNESNSHVQILILG